MSIQHHPASEHLLGYASGALGEAASVLVASHLTLCPHCRGEVGRMEHFGGVLLEALPAAAVRDQSYARVMAQLAETGPSPDAGRAPSAMDGLVPRPLRDYLGMDDLDRLPWRRFLQANYVDLTCAGRAKGRLLRIPAGAAFPYHGHAGDEMVLVLAGAFSDHTGTYRRGDVATADVEMAHTPVAEFGATCLCMTVNDGAILPTRLLAPLARLFR